MKRQFGWIARCVLFIIMTCFLIYTNGLVGLIDFSQFGEVFLTACIIGVVIRLFRKCGLSYLMEWTSLIAGILWAVINALLIWRRYSIFDKIMFSISALSFWYGLLFSICNSLLISIYFKNKKKRFISYE